MYPRPHADDERIAPEDREKALGILAILLSIALPFVIGANEIVFASIAFVLFALVALAIWQTERL
jgi:hypothetical protein